MALGALRAHSLYSLSQTANHIKCHPGHVAACTTKTIQGGTGVPAEDGHHHPSRGR